MAAPFWRAYRVAGTTSGRPVRVSAATRHSTPNTERTRLPHGSPETIPHCCPAKPNPLVVDAADELHVDGRVELIRSLIHPRAPSCETFLLFAG